MEGLSSLTKLEWQELAAAVPGGSTEADIQFREKLFKELIVRAQALPHNRFKAANKLGLKGTLHLGDTPVPLTVVLGKHGVSKRCADAVMPVHTRAFWAAKKWVESISVIAEDCIDMNQFHAFLIYIACHLSLAHFLLQQVPNTTAIDIQTFQGLLKALTSPTQALLSVPWNEMSTFKSWSEDIEASFYTMADRDGVIQFDDLVERCSSSAVEAFVASDDGSCRKRAFQLLQALNNMPSLPNAVPGPMKPNQQEQQGASAPASARRRTSSQWTTSNRTEYSLFSPRVPQANYAPAIQSTQRDIQWRVFPMDQPSLYTKHTKGKLSMAGERMLTPRVNR
jgi:hypothetical protein